MPEPISVPHGFPITITVTDVRGNTYSVTCPDHGAYIDALRLALANAEPQPDPDSESDPESYAAPAY